MTFSEDAEKVKSGQHLQGDMKYKSEQWQRENRCVLFDYLMQFDYTNIFIPKSIRDSSMRFLCESDDFACWMNNTFVETENEEDTVSIKNITKAFKMGLKEGSREPKRCTAEVVTLKLKGVVFF